MLNKINNGNSLKKHYTLTIYLDIKYKMMLNRKGNWIKMEME